MSVLAEIDPKYIGKRGNVTYEANHKLVATWVSTKDFGLLCKLADGHGVKLSVYLRAIIVDALEDERSHCINIKA